MSISDDTEEFEPASTSDKPEYSKRALRGDELLMRSFRPRIEQSAIWWSLCASTRTQAGMRLRQLRPGLMDYVVGRNFLRNSTWKRSTTF
jgi:hypothetical protein